MSRERIDLTGPWRFQPDPCGEGHRLGYPSVGYDVGRWREVAVPCSFDQCLPGMEFYEGAGWYTRSVRVPDAWRGRRVMLRFEGVNDHARVWVNGRLAGENEDGFLPFELPVADLLRYGEDNVIVVRVDNERRQGDVPGMQRGWRPYGGILREVELLSVDPCHIAAVDVTAGPSDAGGTFAARVRWANARAHPVDAEVVVEVADSGGRACACFASGRVAVSPGGQADVGVEGVVTNARLWSPDGPALYKARVALRAGERCLDRIDVRFGFRRIAARGETLLLNGRRVFLTGCNRHEDSPRTGMCVDLETARRDFAEMKRAGANFVRLCHYPHHPGELDLCDELGLLVMCEIPLYWWDGLAEGKHHCAKKIEAARRQLAAMIDRDRNHPSVVFWSVSNETHDERPEVADGNASLVRLARQLDPTRLAVHVSDSRRWTQRPHFEADDVICVNGYPTWEGRSGNPFYDMDEATRFWAEQLRTLHERYPGKCLFVTEFGYPCLRGGLFDNAAGQDAQAMAIRAELAGMSAPYVCGATIWCYADHAWPGEGFLGGLTMSPYGLLSRERRKRKAFEVVKQLFTERQAGFNAAGPAAAESSPTRPAASPPDGCGTLDQEESQ